LLTIKSGEKIEKTNQREKEKGHLFLMAIWHELKSERERQSKTILKIKVFYTFKNMRK
jgi:hypothetical protein